MFDAFAPLSHLPRPTLVGKQELARIPLFGRYAVCGRLMLALDRQGGAGALRRLMAAAQEAMAKGRQLLIFPEGTRTAPGDPPRYKTGVAGLYAQLGVPCVPLATNAGAHWPPHGLIRRPGVIVFEYLPPISPGLEREAFMRELEERIEGASCGRQ
jgi:1-acyl-sn-glycerol-3-phosphate acyltransferase